MSALEEYTKAGIARESEGPIRDTIYRCNQLVDSIHKATDSLAIRLESILSSQPPDENVVGVNPSSSSSDLYNRCDKLESYLQTRLSAITNLEARIEL